MTAEDRILYSRQSISTDDIEAVVAVLHSDLLTQGPCVPAFEQAVVAQVGSACAVACNSATSALHIACLALGLGPGDHLWTSPITFVASANCARYCGAEVGFVDVDPVTGNMSVAALENRLIAAEREDRLPRIVVPVHLAGLPCEMEAIAALGRRFGFHIIEDASHAIGARYQGLPVGDGRYSDITIFSFHPVKIITTGEGGMALTLDAALAGRLQLLRSHAITRDTQLMSHTPDGPWYYEQTGLGYNYRMTDMAAALGISQMRRLHDFVARRTLLADRYDQLLADLPLRLAPRSEAGHSAWHLYIIRVDAKDRLALFEHMRADNLIVNVHYIPVYRQPYYAAFGYPPDDYPEAEQYYREAISIPLHPGMSEQDQDRVVASIRRYYAEKAA
ncbi:MAG: hypothetical protein RIQ52_1861 [Pseudomonadota bacterium]